MVLSGAGGDELFAGYPWRYFRGLNGETEEEYFRDYYGFWQRLVDDDKKAAFFAPDVLRRRAAVRVVRRIHGRVRAAAGPHPDT